MFRSVRVFHKVPQVQVIDTFSVFFVFFFGKFRLSSVKAKTLSDLSDVQISKHHSTNRPPTLETQICLARGLLYSARLLKHSRLTALDRKQEALTWMRPRQAGSLGGFNGAVVGQPCKAKPATQALFTAVDGGLEVRALAQRVDLAVKILLTSSFVHSSNRTKPPGSAVTSADPPLGA